MRNKIIDVLVPGFLLRIWRAKLDSGEGQKAGAREETGAGEGGKREQKLTRRSFGVYYCKNQYPANSPGHRQFSPSWRHETVTAKQAWMAEIARNYNGNTRCE